MTIRKSSTAMRLLAILVVVPLTACDGLGAAGDKDVYDAVRSAEGRTWRDRWIDRRRKPAEILRLAGVGEGMVVIDLLGGSGYYAELLSHLVGPRGRVFLQNNSLFLRFSREGLEERLAGGRLQNVTRIDSEFADLRLPEDVDLIFMGLCYHDIYVPRDDPSIMTSREEFFPQIWRALRPGGRILVIDHAAEPGSGTEGAAWHHRIAEDFAIADFEDAGYRLIGSTDVLRNPGDDYSLRIWDDAVDGKTDRFVLLFEKPVAEGGE